MRTPPATVVLLFGVIAFGLTAAAVGLLVGPGEAAEAPPALLAKLAAARAVDLTWPLDESTPHWPGDKAQPFKIETIATLEKDGVLSKAFHMQEHLGTHIDAPNHFEAFRPSVDEIAIERLYGEAVVIDIAGRVTKDPDTMLGAADVAAFEAKHGKVPEGAIVLLRTGWAGRAGDAAAYKNQDAAGKLHFPGFSPEAARLLVERGVKGIGIDTLSIDRGLSSGFEVHHIVNAANAYGLENLNAALADVPARGAVLIALPIKLRGGSGGPVRAVALIPAGKD